MTSESCGHSCPACSRPFSWEFFDNLTPWDPEAVCPHCRETIIVEWDEYPLDGTAESSEEWQAYVTGFSKRESQ